MNYLIVFLLTIGTCFTLNEADKVGCLKNLVQFENQIDKGVTVNRETTS